MHLPVGAWVPRKREIVMATVNGKAYATSNTPDDLAIVIGIANTLISVTSHSSSERNTGTCYLPAPNEAVLCVAQSEFDAMRQEFPPNAEVSVTLEYVDSGENNVKSFTYLGLTLQFFSSASAAA